MGTLFLVGGARSGKSHLAQALAERAESPVSIVVTAEAGDGEMVERIQRHQDERPDDWTTVEAPRQLADAVAGIPSDQVVLLDCLTFWVSNRILDDDTNAEIEAEAERLGTLLAAREAKVVVVSNEVGHGLVPGDEVSRRFRDVHGRVNRIIAGYADTTALVVAGQLLPLQKPSQVFPELDF